MGQVALLLSAGLAGGAINSLAGGGSLITFPALVTIGLPPITANVTNSIAVCPGYLAAVAGSRADLAGRRRLVWSLVPTVVVGTAAGCALLLVTPAAAFEAIVPFLVIFAALILAFQQRARALVGQPHTMSPRRRMLWTQAMAGIGSIYGGYFGAALGVMLVAGFALVRDETLARISALKNIVSAAVGVTTVAVYGLLAPVAWPQAALVAAAATLGGFGGARLARRLPQPVLRGFIVTFGLVIGGYLLIRAYW
jgi:uncharacterized membrane protein YfcA